jgi:hypothetical protein
MTTDELFPLTEMLVDGLVDRHETSSSGACVVLNCVLRTRGNELSQHASKLVHQMMLSLKSIASEQTLNGVLHCIRSITAHNFMDVCGELLNLTIPYDS